ncbi:MAG TPA: gamma-glutamylcyclotransferase family protein [Devosia sp.]|nr:gamma-glutamylcyclotransferase family protein [Devosia sp.]
MLFAYGTLQDADILSAVLGRPVQPAGLRPATAPGYRAVAYPGRVYPALVVSAADNAPGLLLDGLSDLDLAVLDAFEGEEYRRETIAVLAEGTLRQADAYLPVSAISPMGPAWSLRAWTTAHKPAVLGQESATATALRERLSSRTSS